MSYFYYPDNLYPAPNNSMSNANALCNNISALQNSAGSGCLPFNNYGSYGSSYGYGGYGNPFMNTSYDYSKDKDGNISSSFSQRPDYLGLGLSAIGGVANAVGGVIIAGQQAKVMQQQQLFQNMAYQQQANSLARITEQRLNQQKTTDMITTYWLLQEIMGDKKDA